MKKRLLGLLLIPMTIALASCNASSIQFIEGDSSDYQNAVNIKDSSSSSSKKTLLYTPVYEKTSATLSLTEKTSKETSIEDTVSMVYDSVVSIQASSTAAISSGSGVLVSYDSNLGLSYLVTCFHVIEDASAFDVTLTNGNTYSAELVGGYEDLDLAILSIEKLDLTYAALFENSDELKLGSSVACIGNPLGILPGSVSSGVVSYINRKVQTDDYTTQTLIQTDVAINSGNSGGGLFNTAGALIGIVNAKYAESGIEGLGFAIPSNDVVSTIENILDTAEYDTANKVWKSGYILGDYEYGFTISQGYYNQSFGRKSYVYYVSMVSSNDTYTGIELQTNDIINSIKVDYFDESKTDVTYTVTQSEDPNAFLYNLDLDLDDTLIFNVTRNGSTKDVSIDVKQFIYSA